MLQHQAGVLHILLDEDTVVERGRAAVPTVAPGTGLPLLCWRRYGAVRVTGHGNGSGLGGHGQELVWTCTLCSFLVLLILNSITYVGSMS